MGKPGQLTSFECRLPGRVSSLLLGGLVGHGYRT